MSLFWHPRESMDVASIRHKIGADCLKKECPNLFRILENETVLKHLENLPNILRWEGINWTPGLCQMGVTSSGLDIRQARSKTIVCARGVGNVILWLTLVTFEKRASIEQISRWLFHILICFCFRLQWQFVRIFNKKIESPVIEDQTINSFLYDSENINENDRKTIEALLPPFLEVLKKLRREIVASGTKGERARRFLGGIAQDLDPAKTPASIMFPSMQHDSGYCVIVLTELLIEKHNWVLERFAEELKVSVGLNKVN